MILQLNPAIPVEIVSKGEGYAVGWIDYSQEHNLLWIILLDSGECWIAPNKEVRACKNWTLERNIS